MGDDGFAGGLRLGEAVEVAKLFADAGADAIIPSFGYTSLNGFGMLRGNVPLAQMADALPGRWTRAFATYFGSFLVPQVEYTSCTLSPAPPRELFAKTHQAYIFENVRE